MKAYVFYNVGCDVRVDEEGNHVVTAFGIHTSNKRDYNDAVANKIRFAILDALRSIKQ